MKTSLGALLSVIVIQWMFLLIAESHALIEGIYCGVSNCYDVLGVTRDSTRDEIVKSYRNLARKHHPDVHKTAEAKSAASERFTVIATAYEVLRDEESRREYDYMLDNPEEVYRHYYHYYRRRYAPKVDVRIVVIVTISVVSAFQYYGALSRYKEAVDYLMTVPKYRLKAVEMAKDEGLIGDTAAVKKRNKFKTKQQVKEEEEQIIRKIIEDKMDIRGGYSKPTWKDVLWIQLVILPYTLIVYLAWYGRWFYKFVVLKHEYGDDEKQYLIRKYMKLSQRQWDALEDVERDEYMDLELWVKTNFSEWKRAKEEEMKAKLAENASYKRYRRWMKKGGPGQMTFMED